jgi:hypothetical protein
MRVQLRVGTMVTLLHRPGRQVIESGAHHIAAGDPFPITLLMGNGELFQFLQAPLDGLFVGLNQPLITAS